jgi:hypothetical protein
VRRRDLFALAGTLVGTLAARSILAQPRLANARAAVVIGVNKAGGLPTLSAAASGARTVANWLRSEGFEVKLFVDDKGPVKANHLFEAIAELVDRGTLDQLIVYFSGHGFLNAYSEYWLLSGAPQNPNEAVSLNESVILAKETAIRNVVFISDACRSTPDSIGTSRVRGSIVFPNLEISRNMRAYVDQFLAALPGSPAAEIPVSESVPAFEGIFTSCLLSAFRDPPDSMVQMVDGVRVLPNKNLKTYLESEVVKRAEAKSVRLHQRPDATIYSDDTTYIARVTNSFPNEHGPMLSLKPNLQDLAALELQRAGAKDFITLRSEVAADEINSQAGAAEFAKVQVAVLAAREAAKTSLFSRSLFDAGFLISGTQVVQVVTSPNASAELRNTFDARGVLSKVDVSLRDANAASVALSFKNGLGTVIAALRGYECSVVVDDTGVASANYVQLKQGLDARADRLHASVVASAKFGVFRIDGEPATVAGKARDLRSQIQIGKSTDPTLGLYVAYAYAQAGLIDELRSMGSDMHADLGIDLFDIALLGRQLSGSRGRNSRAVFPFCPMLAQGWDLLRVLKVTLPADVDRLRDHLRSAFWTTFDSGGMTIANRALRNGKLQ